jgi:hypothetical protein
MPCLLRTVLLRYVASYDSDSLSVVNIASASSPSVSGTYTSETYLNGAWDVVAPSSTYVCVSAYFHNRLTIVDVSNPSSPTFKGSLYSSWFGAPRGLALSAQSTSIIFMVAQHGRRINAIDVVRAPCPAYALRPRVVHALLELTCDCSHAFQYPRLRARAQSNPASPTISGSLYSKAYLNQASAVAVVSDRAYVVTLNDYLTIVNVANPASMLILGTLQDTTKLNYASAIAATTSYAYVSAPWYDGVTVIDVSTPASPSVVGSITSSSNLGDVRGLFLSGSNLYAANAGSTGVSIIDVSDPASPSIGQSVTTSTASYASTIIISGSYCCECSTRASCTRH